MGATSWRIQVKPDTVERLTKMADDLGCSMTANGIAAMTVFEISRIPAKDLWLALGAIRQFAPMEPLNAPIVSPRKLPAAKLEISR